MTPKVAICTRIDEIFVLHLMNFAFKMMNFASKMMNFALKMMIWIRKTVGSVSSSFGCSMFSLQRICCSSYCGLQYKCHLFPILSIENEEWMENCPWTWWFCVEKWPFILQFEVICVTACMGVGSPIWLHFDSIWLHFDSILLHFDSFLTPFCSSFIPVLLYFIPAQTGASIYAPPFGGARLPTSWRLCDWTYLLPQCVCMAWVMISGLWSSPSWLRF